MRPIVIMKTGDTLPGIVEARGDFDAWIAPELGVDRAHVDVVEVHRDEPLPDADAISGTVVTGSPAMVTDREPWSVRSGEWLAGLVSADVPILGICYGHQLLADALGGEVGKNPLGREIGTVEVELANHDDDPLFGGLGATVQAHTTHVESVLRLPDGAHHLGGNSADPHHAFRVGEVAWGVQFHPEFDGDIMRRYIRARHEILQGEGIDADGLHEAVVETPGATGLIARFGALVARLEAKRA